MVAKMHVMLHNDCDAVIALSKKMQQQLDGWGSTTSTTLLPTGVDPLPAPSKDAIKQFRAQHNIPMSDRVLISVSRLSREKNLDLLLDAFVKIRHSHTDVTLMFVGDADYREALESRAETLGIADKVVFTGRIKRSKLGIAYGSSDIFLFPSHTDTQGLVVHEAAGARLPLVLCDQAVSEVFIPDETGLFAKDNAEDMANVVVRLLEDKSLRTRLGKNAAKKAAEFTELGQMQKLESLYEKCVSEHKKINFAGGEW